MTRLVFECLTFNASKCLCRKFASQKRRRWFSLNETQQPTITVTTKIHLNTLTLLEQVCFSTHQNTLTELAIALVKAIVMFNFSALQPSHFAPTFFFLFILHLLLSVFLFFSSFLFSAFVFAICAHISGMLSRNEFYYSCYFDNFLE